MIKNMETVSIRDEFIKLGQLMKLAGMAQSGADAKEYIQAGKVSVNGTVETQRGKKIHPGDVVSFKNRQVKVEQG